MANDSGASNGNNANANSPRPQEEVMHPSFINTLNTRDRIKKKLSSIKHKIGVYSAKGGVGKTTVAVNVAYELSKKGFSVGLLDADIDCPNVTVFLGINDMMDTSAFPLKPIEKDGVKVASTAMLVDDLKKPIIWRGPIIVKMLYDFFENTDWGPLDYLIIDLPPGTSDAPLTIMQVLDVDGFVIVTTPQRVAMLNSIRSAMMAKRLGKAVLGIVENMYEGKEGDIDELTEKAGAKVIGRINRDIRLSESSDSGEVAVLKYADIEGVFSGIVDELTR
ncbi:ATP-binding Mrp/Nbp35 family protein [mine drainage metagenome]|uniref:ATP-binding Mrp/Nbp35 family protein n=1 Tax=mine drainage metagenome TaxID=410659 RepID=T1B2G3_9ZZZZ